MLPPLIFDTWFLPGTSNSRENSCALSPGRNQILQGHSCNSLITGSGVNDTLTIDYTNGNPLPRIYSSATLSALTFSGGTGTNSVTIDGAPGANLISIGGNSVVFNSSPISLTSTQSVILATGASNDVLTQTSTPTPAVTFNGGTGNDTLNVNGGTFTFTGNPEASTSTLLVFVNSGSVTLPASSGTGIVTYALADLNLAPSMGTTVNTPSVHANRSVLVLGFLAVGAGATLNLGGNDMIVHNGSLSAITALLATGINALAWNGTGIDSSAAAGDATHLTAIGVMLNFAGGAAFYSTFDGQSVSTTDVLLKYTYYGDANLDGTVNGDDYTLIDTGFNTGLSGWFNGDFNYDGLINSTDYSLIDNSFANQGAPL
jgi:fibronectin-binding autotransporter adhesin